MNHQQRLPALDGLRGLALALILQLHLFFFPGKLSELTALKAVKEIGWLGLELFFVLSGFLITMILVDTKSRPARPYFVNFYAKRALRVFPAYFILLTLYLILAQQLRVVDFGDDPAMAAEQMPWFWTYMIGLWPTLKGTPIISSLTHLWSLTLEEHFYLLWPLVIFFTPKKHLRKLCAGGILLALLLRTLFVMQGAAPLTIFYLIPFRMDGFFAGALAAFYFRDQKINPGQLKRFATRLSLVGAVVLVTFALLRGGLRWSDVYVQSAGLSIVEISIAAWLVTVAMSPPESRQFRFFASRPLRSLGKYSYGFYLVHYPLHQWLFFHWTRHHMGDENIAFVVITHALGVAIASYLGALVSWHLVEKHFLRLKDRFA